MTKSTSLQTLRDSLPRSDRMPLVFLGHGSPMNAIEESENTRAWRSLGEILPRPKAILVVSAHWMSRGTTMVDVSAMPRIIYDFYGFPDALSREKYPASGAPELAKEVASLLSSHHGQEDDTWGLDHGAWVLLKYLYPAADVPVFQVSIDITKDMVYQLEIGKILSQLRGRGVLILGSGNVVHNLRTVEFGGKPHDYATEFDERFSELLVKRDFKSLSSRSTFGRLLAKAHPTLDHYLPTLTIAGASDARDELTFVTDTIDLGSISMRSFVFHSK